MEASHLKTVQFSGDEFIQIGEIARPIWERGASEDTPKLAIFAGGPGSGKTTMRRQQCATGYVHFDFGDIYTALKKGVGETNPKLMDYVALASQLIFNESLENKKNIAIEIIGDNYEVLTILLEKMTEIGYKVSVNGVVCDPVEAYKRHLSAVENDPDYIPALQTEDVTLGYFFTHFNLEMPKKP